MSYRVVVYFAPTQKRGLQGFVLNALLQRVPLYKNGR